MSNFIKYFQTLTWFFKIGKKKYQNITFNLKPNLIKVTFFSTFGIFIRI